MTLTKRQSMFILANYLLGYLFIYPLLIVVITFVLQPFGIRKLDLLCEIGCYSLTFGIHTWFARDLLVDEWLKFKRHWKMILLSSLKWTCLLWIVMMGLQLILNSIMQTTTSVNQTVILQQITQNPLKIMLLTCIFAPIVEEVVFRGAMYQWVNSKRGPWMALIISSGMFGLLHVFSSILSGNWSDCVYILVYSSMGVILCLASRSNKTIVSSILVHGFNNLVSIAIMLL